MNFFQQAGIRQDIRVTATKVRKMIGDKAFELSPTKKRLIHGHMKHQERTADSNYVLQVNAERASRAHELMQDIIRDADTCTPAASSPAVGERRGNRKTCPWLSPLRIRNPLHNRKKRQSRKKRTLTMMMTRTCPWSLSFRNPIQLQKKMTTTTSPWPNSKRKTKERSHSHRKKVTTSSLSTEASKYRPSGTDAGSSEEWSGEEGRTTKKTSSPKKLLSSKKTSSPKKMATPAASASSGSARPSAGKPESAADSSVSKCSHHKNTACPMPDCDFCGTDLCRHLNVHVKKGGLAEESISHILTIACAGDRQFGSQISRKGKKPLPGKQRKWCPVPLCDAIVIDVGRHLVNPSTHGISKNSREYQRLLRLAKPYTGLAEMEGNLAAPAPTIVEQRQDSSASCSFGHPPSCRRRRLWYSTSCSIAECIDCTP